MSSLVEIAPVVNRTVDIQGAAEILGIGNPTFREAVRKFRDSRTAEVLADTDPREPNSR